MKWLFYLSLIPVLAVPSFGEERPDRESAEREVAREKAGEQRKASPPVRDGERINAEPRSADRPVERPREGDRPRAADRLRDGDRPREGDRLREEFRRPEPGGQEPDSVRGFAQRYLGEEIHLLQEAGRMGPDLGAHLERVFHEYQNMRRENPEMAEQMVQRTKLEMRSEALGALFRRSENPEQREHIARELMGIVERSYALRLQAEKNALERMEREIKVLEERIHRREAARGQLIEKRINELTGHGDAGLDW